MTNSLSVSLGDRNLGAYLGMSFAVEDASPHRAVAVEVIAHPWSGTLDAAFSAADLRAFAADLRSDEAPRRVVLGGDRARELELKLARQSGPPSGEQVFAVEARLAWTGDDPFPELRWLMFDVTQEQVNAAAAGVDVAAAATAGVDDATGTARDR